MERKIIINKISVTEVKDAVGSFFRNDWSLLMNDTF